MENISWPLEGVEPREVQLAALSAGYGKSGYAYFLRQRLGKTWLAYAEYKLLKAEGFVDWFVVICPNSIKQQWLEAIEDVDIYEPVVVYSSQKKDRVDYFFKKNRKGGVLIINYESVRSFYDNQGWSKINPLRTYLVADESTKIADYDTKMTKAALELAALCQYTRVMTGKPSKGSNNNLWAQLKFIGATNRSFIQHQQYFTIIGGTRGGKTSVMDVNTEILKREMEPFCFIATDKHIEGFKKVYEPMRRVHMLGEQARMYEAMEKELIVELTSDIKMTAPIILVKYLRLQQISSGIGSVKGKEDDEVQHFNLVSPDKNPRIKAVKEILDNETGKKTIIVCRFKLSIKNLKEELEKDGHKVAIMHGGMGAELDRQKKLFTEGDYDILLAQLQVLNFGHTLCCSDDGPCEDIIFYENNFSLTDRAQCESRPEKLGRQSPISVWDFYASQMDRMMVKTLVKKEDASMALMGYARDKGILHRGEE